MQVVNKVLEFKNKENIKEVEVELNLDLSENGDLHIDLFVDKRKKGAEKRDGAIIITEKI